KLPLVVFEPQQPRHIVQPDANRKGEVTELSEYACWKGVEKDLGWRKPSNQLCKPNAVFGDVSFKSSRDFDDLDPARESRVSRKFGRAQHEHAIAESERVSDSAGASQMSEPASDCVVEDHRPRARISAMMT